MKTGVSFSTCSLINQLTKRLNEIDEEIAEMKKPATAASPPQPTAPPPPAAAGNLTNTVKFTIIPVPPESDPTQLLKKNLPLTCPTFHPPIVGPIYL